MYTAWNLESSTNHACFGFHLPQMALRNFKKGLQTGCPKIRPNFCACPWHSPTSAGGRLDTRRAPNDIFVLQSLWTRGCLRLGGVWAAAFRWQKLNWCVHDTTQKGTTALRRSMHTLSFNIFPIPSVCFYNPMTWENPNISQPSASSGGPTSEMSILFHRG